MFPDDDPPGLRGAFARFVESLPGGFLAGRSRVELEAARKYWKSLSDEERERRMAELHKWLEENRYSSSKSVGGRRRARPPRTGRPPKGALPVPDDTPWGPQAKRRSRNR